MTANDVEYQLTPKGKHSRNSAEKSAQTWKYHFLPRMSLTHPDFKFSQWSTLFEQGNITLNLLWPFILNLKVSAYAQVFGALDYQKTPLPPPGMKVLAHVLLIDRHSFDPHVIKGFSVGVAM